MGAAWRVGAAARAGAASRARAAARAGAASRARAAARAGAASRARAAAPAGAAGRVTLPSLFPAAVGPAQSSAHTANATTLTKRVVASSSMERVVIVGAGTFGASLAWWLARRGDDVTLVDQFEPGDVRATSGGETRLIRCTHGADADYARMARRARTLWRELEAESGEDLMSECGVSWFAHRDDGWETASLKTLAAEGIPVERLEVAEAARQFPSFNGDDLAWVLHEPEAGVLRAQKAIQTLAEQAK